MQGFLSPSLMQARLPSSSPSPGCLLCLSKRLLVCLILCVVGSVSVGGPLWLSVWLWQAVYREACCCQLTIELSLPAGLRSFASPFPPQSISAMLCVPLSISVCVYQWINKHLPLCFPSIPSSKRQKERGPFLLEWHQEFPLSLCFLTLPSSSTMTLLASERSLLIRNKFRSGEVPGGISSCQLKGQ